MVNYDEVAYAPKILRSMDEICKAFGVGKRSVRAWVKAGAPIVIEGKWTTMRYSAELMRLQVWREKEAEKKTGRN